MSPENLRKLDFSMFPVGIRRVGQKCINILFKFKLEFIRFVGAKSKRNIFSWLFMRNNPFQNWIHVKNYSRKLFWLNTYNSHNNHNSHSNRHFQNWQQLPPSHISFSKKKIIRKFCLSKINKQTKKKTGFLKEDHIIFYKIEPSNLFVERI